MNQPEDVEFVLSHDRRYKFHASVLTRNSVRLDAMITERSAVTLSNKAKNAGIKNRWLIALTGIPNKIEPGGRLDLVQLNAMGEPLGPHHGLMINENGRIPIMTFAHYETILFAFYGHPLKVADSSMEEALQDTLELVDIAEYLGCTPVIAKPIDVALMKHGQDFFRSIQKMPWCWVGLAIALKSELIFKEAIVHLAGNWRVISSDRRAMAQLRYADDSICGLCERLLKASISKAKKLELAVMSLYPGGMAAPSTQLPIKRDEYAKDVLVWMALSFFRHWLGQRIVSEKGSLATDSGYELYTQLGAAGEAYMDKSVMNQFHAKFPMTKKAMHVLENHLFEIKECVKEMVQKHAILKNECMLDTHRYPVNYLTCTEIDKTDFPWWGAVEELGARVGLERGIKRSRGKEIRMTGNEIVRLNLEAQRSAALAEEARQMNLTNWRVDLEGVEENKEETEEQGRGHAEDEYARSQRKRGRHE